MATAYSLQIVKNLPWIFLPVAYGQHVLEPRKTMKELKKKKKLSANENLHSLCAACSRSVEGKEIWTEEEKLTLRKETGKMIFSCLCL